MRKKRESRRTVFFKGKIINFMDLFLNHNPNRINKQTLYYRLFNSKEEMTVEEALSMPVKEQRKVVKKYDYREIVNVHPDVLHEMQFGTNQSFIEVCERVKKIRG